MKITEFAELDNEGYFQAAFMFRIAAYPCGDGKHRHWAIRLVFWRWMLSVQLT